MRSSLNLSSFSLCVGLLAAARFLLVSNEQDIDQVIDKKNHDLAIVYHDNVIQHRVRYTRYSSSERFLTVTEVTMSGHQCFIGGAYKNITCNWNNNEETK